MKQIQSISATILFILLIICSVYGQKNYLKQSIYFETDKYDLSTDSKIILDELLDSLKNYQSYKILLNGNTDNVGDSIYNKTLSEKRIIATRNYFIENGIIPKAFKTIAFGEEKPIADNFTVEGKQKNRRVDISITFTRKIPIDSSQFQPSIGKLYKLLETKPQEFCVNPERDTAIRCKMGTVLYIRANSFKVSNACKGKCLTIKVKEDFLKSDMIFDNLSTTSNGQMIESQGMVYTEANDCKGNKLNLLKDKDFVIFVPTDTIIPEAKIFQGNRTPHDSIMNWTLNNNSVLVNFTLNDLTTCGSGFSEGIYYDCGKCDFFFCRIKRIGKAISGIFDPETRANNFRMRTCLKQLHRERKIAKVRSPNKPLPVKTQLIIRPELDTSLISTCEKLQALYEKFGVSNTGDLLNAINQPLLDSFGVKNMQELQDTLKKINKRNVELSYLNKKISYEDFRYYVYNTPQLGWSNVDVFTKYSANKLVKMKIDLKQQKNIDCKLVFKKKRIIIPPSKTENKIEFDNVPKGEEVWIVAIKYENGKPFLSMQETVVDDKTYPVDFKELTLEELKQQLEKLDK